MKLVVLCAMVAIAAAIPSDFHNDVIFKGRRAAVEAASPCSCISNTCKPVPPTNGGTGTCTSTIKHTKTCAGFSCNTGWQASGKVVTGTCNDGRLSFGAGCKGEPCKNFKAKSVTPSGGAAGDCVDSASWAHGSHCLPKCKKGEVYKGQVQCSGTKITQGKCVAATCDFSATITNGSPHDCTATMTPTSSKAATCTPKCNDGFKKTGSTYTCTYPSVAGSAAATSGTTVTCAPKTCDASTLLTNAAAKNDCTTTLSSGGHCTQHGKSDYVCTKSTCKNGKLTAGVCSPINCAADIKSKVTKILLVDTCSVTTEAKGTCKMKCADGYKLTGGTYTCQQSSTNAQGTVTGSATCAPKACPASELKAALNQADIAANPVSSLGSTTVTGTYSGTFAGGPAPSGTTVTVACKTNYSPTQNVKCTNGKWANAKCEKKCSMSTLNFPTDASGRSGGSLKCNKGGSYNMNAGQSCDFQCTGTKYNQHAHGKKDTAKCVNGVITQPVCQLNVCDLSAAPKDGTKGDCTKTVAAGGQCTPTCDTGFTLSAKHSTCNSDATTKVAATCNPKTCKIKSVPQATAVAGTCTMSGSTAAMKDGSTCTLQSSKCNTDHYLPSNLKVACNDGVLTCTGCHSTCAPGQSCRGSGAADCTACPKDWVHSNVLADGTGTCKTPTSWKNSDHMYVSQTVYFDSSISTKGNSKAYATTGNKAKYQGCYARALDYQSSVSNIGVSAAACSSGAALPTGFTVQVTVAARRKRVTAKFLAKYLCPKPVTAACKAKVTKMGSSSTKMTKSQLTTAFSGASLANIEAVLAAQAYVTSSASSTSILAMTSVVAMLAGLFCQ